MGKAETCLRCGLPLYVEDDDWLWAGNVCVEGQRIHRRCPPSVEPKSRTWDAAKALRACGEKWNGIAEHVDVLSAMPEPVEWLDHLIAHVRREVLAFHEDSIDAMRLRKARDKLALLRVVLSEA